jgi:CheY-like chemotaxis protein
MMPHMNGREAYEHAHRRCPHLPVLFCSGYSEEALRSDKALPPGTQLLHKPYTPQMLVKTVQELIDRSESVSHKAE